MSRKRDYIPLKERLAAALRIVGQIPFEHAQQLTADQIISLFQFDHYPIPHAEPFNGPDVHWNLVPMLIAPHREKSAKHDTPEIAKTRRLSAAHEEFRRRMLAKGGQCEPEPAKKSSRPKRKVPSRPIQGWRRMNGEIVWRNKRPQP